MKRAIRNLDDLVIAANNRQSVTIPGRFGWSPAAFVLNQQGWVLRRMFMSGLKVYEPKTKKSFGQKMKGK